MSTVTEDNDGRFPDEAPVLTRYPLRPTPQCRPGQSNDEFFAALNADRETWPWLLGTVEQQCGPDEWLVTIEDRRLAQLEDGRPAPEDTADNDLLFPQAYRDASEIRGLPADPELAGPAFDAQAGQ